MFATHDREGTRVTIMDDGIRLSLKLDMPDGAPKRCPVLVILHGFTGFKEERHLEAVARTATDCGFAALRADLYGHGQSGGTFREHTLYKWLTNALTVIDYARSLDFADDVYLCGHSQGGLTAILAAAMKHDVIAGLIPLSPAVMIPEIARQGELLGKTFDPDHVPDALVSWDGRELGGNYVRVAQTIDVDRAIARYDGPVLLVHGDADEAVPVEYGIAAAKAYRNAELVIIPGDDHCYNSHLDQVTDAVRAWLLERSRTREQGTGSREQE